YGAGIILAQNVLHGVNIMLAHIAEATAIIIPITPESGMHPVWAIGFVGSRPQPHIVVEFLGHGHGGQVVLAYPVKLPVETSNATDGNLERPSEQTVLHGFFKGFYGGVE